MNTKKNYYLFVPADNIYKKVNTDDDQVLSNKVAEEVFKEYNVPTKYRHIVIKKPFGGIAEPNDAFEMITKKMFYFKTPFLKVLLNPIGNHVIELLTKDIAIITENKIVYSAEVVKEFYQEIIDKNIASNYDNAVRTILGIEKINEHKGLFTRIKKKK